MGVCVCVCGGGGGGAPLTQTVAVLGVEAGVVDEVDAAANHVARCECGSVWLTGAGGAEGVAVISVVTIRVLVPTWRG